MRRMAVLLLPLAAAMLVLAAPVAANDKPTTGTQIRFFGDIPATFPANTPFFVEQGFIVDLGDGPAMQAEISAHSDFTLYINGVLQPSTVDVDFSTDFGGSIEKRYLTNFPDGLPVGVYTFHGVFNFDASTSKPCSG